MIGASLIPVVGLAGVQPGDVLSELIAGSAPELADGDVVVVARQVVSVAEGRVVPIDRSDPSAVPRLVAEEAVRVLRRRSDATITETSHGFVCADAGIELAEADEGRAVLLPLDADRSARRIRDGLRARTSVTVGVIVADRFGRPWRSGLTSVALGCAGVAAVVERRSPPGAGRTAGATAVCVADELASAAALVMGTSPAVHVAIVRGIDPAWLREGSVAGEVVRSPRDDLFR